MARWRRLVLGVLLTLHFAVPITTAHNWGAGDREPDDHARLCAMWNNLSECTPKDSFNFFWIDPNWDFQYPNLEAEFRDSVQNDFDSLAEVGGEVVTTYSSTETDVIVMERTLNATWDMAYTTCSTSAVFGYVEKRYYMWCRPQWLVIQDDPTAFSQCWNTPSCVTRYMCHEIGHTYGLQHYKPTDSNPSSCMSYANNSASVLNAEDKDHLYDCFPRPSIVGMPSWADESRTTLCKDFE